MMEKRAVQILMILSAALGILCFFPGKNLLNYKAQYLEGIKAQGREREIYAERVVKLNPLFPHGHLLLASVYLTRPEGFKRAMEEIDIAVALGPYRRGISWNAFKTYLSLWPFLPRKEKQAALQAGKFAVRTASRKRIQEMLSLWRRFCRDFDFIYQVLNEKPGYMNMLAQEIYRSGLPLKWRWKALARYEKWLFETTSRNRPEEMSVPMLKKTLKILDSIKFYHRLAGTKFEEKVFHRYRERVLFQLAMLTQEPEFVEKYLKFSSLRDEIKKLREELQQDGFLSRRDFKHFYLKELFRYKLREYEALKDEIEAFRQSVKWVKREEVPDYIAINLLLVDVYYQENLLLKASSILQEMMKLETTPEILLRLKRIKELTGENFSASLPGFYYSNPVTLKAKGTKFLFSPPVGEKTLHLKIEPLSQGRLLQVFMDGEIAKEIYWKNRETELVIILPPAKDYFRIEIKLLK